MSKLKKDTIEAKGFAIQIYTEDFKNDYISLTDIARYKNVHEPKDVVKNWLRVRDTIELVSGRLFTILILKGSNSTPLERKQEQMHLHYHLKDGLKIQMRSVLFLNLGEAEERSLILSSIYVWRPFV